MSLSWNLGDKTTMNTSWRCGLGTYLCRGHYTVTLTASMRSAPYDCVSYRSDDRANRRFQAWAVEPSTCTNRPQAQPNADPYGKGISNTNQFLLGLNPTNPASVFQILGVTRSGSDLQIMWATAGGITNVVQTAAGSTDGSYSSNFVDISPLIIIQGGGDTTTNYLSPGVVTNSSTLYYRVRLQQ